MARLPRRQPKSPKQVAKSRGVESRKAESRGAESRRAKSPSEPKQVWAVVAGGGTGGHVLPGLAISEEISRRCQSKDSLHWITSLRGPAVDLIDREGYSFTALQGRGIARKLTPQNLLSVAHIGVATTQAIILMRRLRPAVVIGLGGFASLPGALAAIALRIPLVVSEQNASPSAANRLLARFAKASAVPFGLAKLPRAHVTGTPVRAKLMAIDRTKDRQLARQNLKVGPNRYLLSVFGGSLGARRINEALLEAIVIWKDRDDLTIRFITGKRDHINMNERIILRPQDPLELQVVEFQQDMADVYAASDLVLCRAGATTVAELCRVGMPSILVPLPGAPSDHQNANAQVLASAGAAVVVSSSELDGMRLCQEVDALLGDAKTLAKMSESAKSLHRSDATAAIVDLLEVHAKLPLPNVSRP